jgi:hypothetical protein
MVCPLDGTKVHGTFVLFRLALQHIGEPLEPPVLRPARGPPDEFFADQTICLDEQINQDRYAFEPDQRLSW